MAGAGCALEALLRNPLAEPFTLGISSGSSLCAVIAIRIGAERAFGHGAIGGAALVGAVATMLAIWRLAQVGGNLPQATLILAGVAISMFCWVRLSARAVDRRSEAHRVANATRPASGMSSTSSMR